MAREITPPDITPHLKKIRPFRADAVPVDTRFSEIDLPDPPYDIEVGCGVGYHPIRYALENPERKLLAIERTHERFRKFLGRIRGNDVGSNLVPIHSDALPWIVHHIPQNSVRRYFFLYPNPFPKHRRWYAMPFMEYVIETMMPGGTLQMATNVDEYYQEAKAYFTRSWGLDLIEDRLIGADEKPRTHFEKKYLVRGEPCWNLVFQKPEPSENSYDQ
jgi:tRNA (guanine-N7-)-methyltransferase